MTKLEKLKKESKKTLSRFIWTSAIYTTATIIAMVTIHASVDFDVLSSTTLEDKVVISTRMITYYARLAGIFSFFALAFVCELIATRGQIHEYNMKIYLVRLLGKQDEEASDHDA